MRFTFGISRDSAGADGEVSQTQLDSAINGTSANTSANTTLDTAFANPELESIRHKLNEMILNGRR